MKTGPSIFISLVFSDLLVCTPVAIDLINAYCVFKDILIFIGVTVFLRDGAGFHWKTPISRDGKQHRSRRKSRNVTREESLNRR